MLFFFSIALIMNIPGYGEICDQDSMAILVLFLIFFPICMIFLFRNISKLQKNSDKKFRKISLIGFSILLILSIGGLNKLIFVSYFGTLKNKAYSSENKMVFINLYKNGKFFSEGFESSCYEQITGTYEVENQNLKLNYDKESEYFSTNYSLKGDSLINVDSKKDILIIERK